MPTQIKSNEIVFLEGNTVAGVISPQVINTLTAGTFSGIINEGNIQNGAVTNLKIAGPIDGGKINPDFGAQSIFTTGSVVSLQNRSTVGVVVESLNTDNRGIWSWTGNASGGGVNIGKQVGSSTPPTLTFYKSRGANSATLMPVNNGDQPGRIEFKAYDGATWIDAAIIGSVIDAAPGINSTPCSLYFSTTAPLENTSTERMRINSNGEISIPGTLRLTNTGDVSLASTGHPFQIGATGGANLAIDSNEIQARNNGEASTLNLNVLGGTVTIGNWTFRPLVGADANQIKPQGMTSATVVDYSFCTTGRIQTDATYSTETNDSANVRIATSGLLSRATSSLRWKKDIENIEPEYSNAVIFNTRPVWFRSKCEEDNPLHSFWGFIAEELAEIDPRLSDWGPNESGELVPNGVKYDRFVPHICVVIKEQKQQIETLTEQLSGALQRIAQLESAQ